MAIAIKVDLQAMQTPKTAAKSSNIVVFGTSSLVSNAITLEQNPIQKVLAMNSIKFVLEQSDLIAIPNKEAFASKLETRTSLSKFALILTSFFFPAIILIAGFWHLALRKRNLIEKQPDTQPSAA